MSEESENSNNMENASSNYRRFEFLTEKEIDTSFLITSLQNILKNSDNSDDKKLLEKILQDFQKENFSILNPQIINFLNNNPIEKWSEYLIFRYKFLIDIS